MKVLSIGHALVDYFVFCREEDTALQGLHLGSAGHVSWERMETLLEKCGESVPMAGGSASNVVKLAAQLGMDAAFVGRCGRDRRGDIFRHELGEAGVRCLLESSGSPTGVCITYLSGGRRTVAAAHSAAGEISPAILRKDHLAGVDILVLEGYLLYHRELMYHALRKAQEAGIAVAFDPGSLVLIDDFREEILALLENYVDYLFLNEEEALALTGLDRNPALEFLGRKCRCIALKLGFGGSLVHTGGISIPTAPEGPEVPDPTGAGDAYAAGFLYGVWKYPQPELWGKAASLVAGEVITVPGSRLGPLRIKDLKEKLDSLG